MTIRLVSELPKTKPSRGEEEAQAQAMNEPNEGLTLKENVNKHPISSRITKKIENSLEEIQTAKDKIKLDRETKHKRILGYIQTLFSTEAELEKANKANQFTERSYQSRTPKRRQNQEPHWQP